MKAPSRCRMSKRRGSRNRYRDFILSEVAPDFRELLCQVRPDLAKERPRDRAAFAYVVWIARIKRRRHRQCADAFFISYQDLEALFGESRFAKLNDRLQIVEVVRDWLPAGAQWDYSPGEATRAFRLAPDVANMVSAYFANVHIAVIPLIHPTGRRYRSPLQAIAPKKRDGSPRKVWRGITLPKLTPVKCVPWTWK